MYTNALKGEWITIVYTINITMNMLCPIRWIPVYTDSSKKLGVMSIGFLLQNKDDAVVWRGPKKNGTLNLLL